MNQNKNQANVDVRGVAVEVMMKPLLKVLGWSLWAATKITLKCVALIVTGAFWLANGGFGEMEGY